MVNKPEHLYCFSCGRPVWDESLLVPICPICERAGPQLERRSIRWRLRGGDNVPVSALSYDEIVKLIAADVLSVESLEAAREGAEWRPIWAHPDFRSLFTPGTPGNEQLVTVRDSRKQVRQRRARRQRLQILGVIASAIAAGIVVIGVIQTGVLELIPGRGGKLNTPSAPAAATAGLPQIPGLPSPESVDQPLPALVNLGQAGVLDGSLTQLKAARAALEAAVAIAPDDPEAVGLLAEVYARLLPISPDLSTPARLTLTRAKTLDPDAVATRRAIATRAMNSGNLAEVIGALQGCGQPVEDVMGGVDLGCALLLAEGRRDLSALETLKEAFPELLGVRLAMARVLHEQQSWKDAREAGQELTRIAPQEPTGWSVLLHAAAALGDWSMAEQAGAKLSILAPYRLNDRHLRAQILLRALGRAHDASRELGAIYTHPQFSRYEASTEALVDGAEAAVSVMNWSRAVELSSQALSNGDAPEARLLQAWARLQGNDRTGAQELLSSLEEQLGTGEQDARSHLLVGLLHLAMDDRRSAVVELDNAIRVDPGLRDAHLARTQALLGVDQLAQAMQSLEETGYCESVYARRRMSLSAQWLPSIDTTRLRQELDASLRSDVRFAQKQAELFALVDWIDRRPDAGQRLVAVATETAGPAVHAALGQWLVENGQAQRSAPHLRRAHQARPNNAPLLAMLAFASAQTGDPNAPRMLQEALTKGGDLPAVMYWSAMTHETLRELRQARADYHELQRMEGGDVLANRALIRLSETEGR
ncbi:MAG: hypothetical protein AAFV53_14020 [Myxococcota bacterium]